MTSPKVKKAIKSLREDDQLVKDLNKALTKVYAKAGAGVGEGLSSSEKVELVTAIAASLDTAGFITGG